MKQRKRPIGWLVVLVGLALALPVARAQSTSETAKFDLYGFAMLDMGYDFKQMDPDWYDVLRPSKIADSPGEKAAFGKDGTFWASVRQSRLGVKSWVPTKLGTMYTIFEFELFGVGVDAGQTTFRLRHAYGELGQFGAGQTWSPFMDPDVFPNSIEYWGPNGMVFFRNVQARWMPLKGEHAVTVALERPGASGDQGTVSGRIELAGIQGRFPLPDISANYRWTQGWGHLQVAGIVRSIKWDDTLAFTPGHPYDLSGSDVGWGINVSTNVKFGKDTLRASVVYGEGIENYMNDAPADIGATASASAALGIDGKALPVVGLVAFYDRTWSDKWTSTIGYSRVDIDNSDLQAGNAFKTGEYALVNALYYPVDDLMFGPEFQWGRRENNSDGWSADDYRLQFSVKYKFGHSWGGK
jgi:hypothetical protein